ncbi:hypothetical protein LS684_11570 [Cytobacillus spongiae]|uniref:hypothetical protein n=1 Tax=Cytobacillus spongiae TaxID=2901381 RepID=UPI001F250F5F|nr:hypothetical protein [Cytobacillus spongiae]UII54326.1 hypothetical protein LS684_11570 [Cytobacillus spongiae]
MQIEMSMYEEILHIIDQKGPVSIPSICHELNGHVQKVENQKTIVQPSSVKSVISRKKDLFYYEDELVCIQPDRNLQSLVFRMTIGQSPSYTVKIDFTSERFTFFEWQLDQSVWNFERPKWLGSVRDFKHALYRAKIWDWEEDHQPNAIVLDGVNWSIELHTKGQTYYSEGLESFPREWRTFTRALTKLIGKRIF